MKRGSDDRSTGSFVRGMTIGALLGAIVAGSSLWSRRRIAKRTAANEAARLAGPAIEKTEPPRALDAPQPTGPDSP